MQLVFKAERPKMTSRQRGVSRVNDFPETEKGSKIIQNTRDVIHRRILNEMFNKKVRQK